MKTKIIEIWQKNLQLEGNEDPTKNYFELGGSSLTVLALMNELKEECGLEITIRDFFQQPTLAFLLEQAEQAKTQQPKQVISMEELAEYDVSPAQELILMDILRGQITTEYNISQLFKISGEFELDRFEQALQEVFHAVPLFSNNFKRIGDKFVQFHTEKELDFEHFTGSINELQPKAFDVEKDCLIRVRYAEEQGERFLFFDIHHLIFDGTSLDLLLKKINQAYQGYELEPAYPYASYVENLKLRHQPPEFNEKVKKNVERLKAYPTRTFQQLANSTTDETGYVEYEFSLKAKLAYKKLKTSLKVSDYVLSSTIFGLTFTLFHHTEAFLYHTPVVDRMSAEFDHTIGNFVNTVSVGFKARPATETIAEVIARTQKETSYMLEYADCYLQDYLAEDPTFSEYLPDMLFLCEMNPAKLDIGAAQLTPVKTTLIQEKTGITFRFHNQSKMKLDCSFKKALYLEESVQSFLKLFETILIEAAAKPKVAIGEYNLVAEAPILAKIAEKKEQSNAKKLVTYQQFEQFAKTQPEKIALIDKNSQISYKELAQKVSQMALVLKEYQAEIGEKPVGLCMEPSNELIMTILALMKTDIAFIALDQKYSPEKCTKIIEENQLAYILTDGKKAKAFPAKELNFIDLAEKITAEKEVASVEVKAKDLFSIVYTSGTTGDAKAIPFYYEQLAEVAQNLNFLNFDEQTKLLQVTNLTFDVFFAAFVVWLENGCQLVMAEKALVQDLPALAQFCRQAAITDCFMPTGLFHALTAEDLAYLKNTRLMVAGEEMSRQQAKIALEQGCTELYNVYGPAEASIYVTAKKIAAADLTKQSLPIGAELATATLLTTSQYGQYLPAFAEGELVIVGDVVSPGYLNNETETQERFDLVTYPDTRAYRTGDLGYYDQTGQFYYLNRLNQEIKVRGQRVNTNTVKQYLLAFSNAIRDVRFAYQNNALYAVIQTDSPATLSQDEVVSHLRKYLPEYMIPSHYFFLETIPLTVNGKADLEKVFAQQAEVAPKVASDKEAISSDESPERANLNAIWNKVLKTNTQYTDRSDFYANGGHSLLLLELVAEIEATFNIKIASHELAIRNNFKEQLTFITEHEPANQEYEAFAFGKRYLLSPIQESLYINWVEAPDSLKNNLAMTVKCEKAILPDLLKKVQHLLANIPILHAKFNSDRTGLYQIVLQLEEVEVAEVRVKTTQEMRLLSKPFNLQTGPLVHLAHVFVEEEQADYLFIEFHHIVMDGQSLKNLAESVLSRQLDQIEDLTYFDYVTEWQQYKESKNYQEDIEYWQMLQGAEREASILPAQNKTERVAKVQAQEVPLILREFTAAEFTKLQALAQTYRVTPFILFVSALAYHLGWLNDSDDITIGTSLGLRKNQEYLHAVGPFVQTIPLRITDLFKQSVSELLRSVAQTYQLGVAHSEIGFPKMVECAKTPIIAGINPLFDIMVINQPVELTTMEELTHFGLEEPDLLMMEERFGISIHLLNQENALTLRVSYDDTRYQKNEIQTFIEQTLNIMLELEQAQPDQLLAAAQPDIVKQAFLAGASESLPEQTILDFWQQHVANQPDDVCVAQADIKLTYQEVDQLATYYASQILENVTPKSPIGLLFNRSIEMYIAIIAVLKAGCYYVPIESQESPEYVQRFIAEQELPLVLIEATYQDLSFEKPSILIERDLQVTKEAIAGVSNVGVTPDDLVTRLCSSGTTGKPKGIQITHRNLINLTGAVPGNEMKPASTILLIANYTFDISTASIFNALVHGSKLYILDANEVMNPANYAEIINREKVDYSFLPTAIFHLIPYESFEKIEYPTTFIAGGENMSVELVNKLASLEKIRVFNMYGPTETTVYSTIYECQGTFTNEIPIGKPVRNTKVAVLNSQLLPVPKGSIGQLMIAGAGVSKGYNQMPELTKEKFVSINGEMFYATGDLVEWDQEGNLLFRGRRDHQVKISGHRVELSDLENALRTFAGYQDIYVLFIEGKLVAFTDCQKIIEPTKEKAATYLEQYRQPNKWILVKEIPLTARGKVDRKELEVLYLSQKEESTSSAPDLQLETSKYQTMVQLWQSVLAEDASAWQPDTDFFQAGGTSIQAIMLLSEMQKIQPQITFQDLVANITLEKMAGLLSQKEGTNEVTEEKVREKEQQENVLVVLPPYMEPTMYRDSFTKVLKQLDAFTFTPYLFEQICEPDYMEQYFEKLKAIYQEHHVPITLLGYSFGGVLAHELSLLLQKENIPVKRIIMVDTYFAENSKYYVKMLRGNFINKRVTLHMMDKMYPELRSISKEVKLQLIRDFQSFYETTNRITSTRTVNETELIFLYLAETIPHMKDTRDMWEPYYPNMKKYELKGQHDKLFTSQEIANTSRTLNEILAKLAWD